MRRRRREFGAGLARIRWFGLPLAPPDPGLVPEWAEGRIESLRKRLKLCTEARRTGREDSAMQKVRRVTASAASTRRRFYVKSSHLGGARDIIGRERGWQCRRRSRYESSHGDRRGLEQPW